MRSTSIGKSSVRLCFVTFWCLITTKSEREKFHKKTFFVTIAWFRKMCWCCKQTKAFFVRFKKREENKTGTWKLRAHNFSYFVYVFLPAIKMSRFESMSSFQFSYE